MLDAAFWTVNNIAVLGSLAGAIATAITTFFLWRVTKQLAVETKRMADLGAQPQIIALIVPNQWSTIHFDLVLENTGNATAFNIVVKFDPPLEQDDENRVGKVIPLQKVSVLKPGQRLQSYLGNASQYLENNYEVEVTWQLQPVAQVTHSLRYSQRMADYSGVSYLGERDPVVQIASEIKKLREDWRWIAGGSRKLNIDTYDTGDRERERAILDERYGRTETGEKT